MCSTAPPALIDYCKEPGAPKRNCLCPVTSKEKSGEARVGKCPPHLLLLRPYGARTLGVGLPHFWATGRMGKCGWCLQCWAGSVVWMLYSSPRPLRWAQLPMHT